MSLRIRHLRLRVITSGGTFGSDISFPDGLVVLRANNTSGKSTCIQAIIYALGLEQMLGPTREVPLPPSMMSICEDEEGGEHRVISSDVYLEIQNENEQYLTIHRRGKSNENVSKKLVSTWLAPMLSDSTSRAPQRDFYTEDAGSATNEDGFDFYLERFIGWDLPLVTRYDGSDVKLYAQTIFPLILIEQKKGWTGIQATVPRFLQIKDVAKRSTEFLLDLQSAELIAARLRFSQQESQLRQYWSRLIGAAERVASAVGGHMQSMPVNPLAAWPPEILPYIAILGKDKLPVPMDEVYQSERMLLESLRDVEVPTAEEDSSRINQELEALYELNSELQLSASILLEDVTLETTQLEFLNKRISMLEDDLRRYRDLIKLKKLGSLETSLLVVNQCPTCRQSIDDSLFEQVAKTPRMSVEDNLEFFKDQRQTFQRIRDQVEASISEKREKLNFLRASLSENQASIRSSKATLISDSRAPSLSEVERRIRLDARVRQYEASAESLKEIFEELANLSVEARTLIAERDKLPRGTFSDSDLLKLDELERLLVEMETQFGFHSFDPSLLQISKDSYLPTREGFNLTFDTSASDSVRLIWGYSLALLELARKFNTNHPGVLIMDEPQQQKPEQEHFISFIQRASLAKSNGQQVIIATSESKDVVEELALDPAITLNNFDGRILVRL